MDTQTKPRVLVAEDDAQLNRLVVTWLRRANIEVDSVFDGEDAIAALKEKEYSAVLLDVMMPRVTGIEVIDYVATHVPKLLSNIVVMTAGGEGVVERVKQHPIRHIFAKPFDLREILEAALDCASLRRGDTSAESRGRLLIVDDEHEWRDIVSKPLLQRFDIEFVRDGHSAIEWLKREDFDAVMLDLHTPDLEGAAVIEYIEEHQKHLLARVVVVTISADEVEGLPVAGVLEKPFAGDALRKLLPDLFTN
jgi:DNA-binding response OmpR family regulator